MRYPQWSLAFTKWGEPKPGKKNLQQNSRATRFTIRYPATKKKSQTKRNVRERPWSQKEIRWKKRWKERERVRQCTRATLCLLIQEKRGKVWRRRSLTKCRQAFRTNNCRRKPRRIFWRNTRECWLIIQWPPFLVPSQPHITPPTWSRLTKAPMQTMETTTALWNL